ncbi:MAG: hypothetical protein ACRCXT_03565 [Paraclostridium sp.]
MDNKKCLNCHHYYNGKCDKDKLPKNKNYSCLFFDKKKGLNIAK